MIEEQLPDGWEYEFPWEREVSYNSIVSTSLLEGYRFKIVPIDGTYILKISQKGFKNSYILDVTIEEALGMVDMMVAGTKHDPDYLKWVKSLNRANLSYAQIPTEPNHE